MRENKNILLAEDDENLESYLSLYLQAQEGPTVELKNGKMHMQLFNNLTKQNRSPLLGGKR